MKHVEQKSSACSLSLLLLTGLFLFFQGCQKNPAPSLLEQALTLAAENRTELEKVLSSYSTHPEDSLKYKAACFLIENMAHHYYYEGEQLEQFQTYYQSLAQYKKKSANPGAILDSLNQLYGSFSLSNLHVKYDLRELDSAYLCNNIEWSFKVWEEQPWGKQVSFDDFCEYILPYRIGDEKPTEWKQEFYEKYNHYLIPLLDSAYQNRDDPVVAVNLLMDTISNRDSIYFTMTAPPGYPHVGPQTSTYLSGSCREFTDYAIYVCRALGIPCYIDFMVARGDNNADHFWISYKDKYGELYVQDFPGHLTIARLAYLRLEAKAKVYRYTYSLNQKIANETVLLDGSAPPLFERPLFKDVTLSMTEYYVHKLHIPSSGLYNQKVNGKVAYLCLSRHMGWEPVAWTRYDKDNLVFKDVQVGSVMRVATWENNQLVFQTAPFVIDRYSNELSFFTPNDEKEEVVLYAKFNLNEENQFRNRMIGGVVEGSDLADFRNKDTLYVINKLPQRLNNVAILNSDKAYKYVRYYGPSNSNCNISELSLYEHIHDTIPLQGQVIGTPGSWDGDGSHEYTNVFDGKTWTSFDYKHNSGGWAGLAFDQPKKISRIVYTPRNRDNYIRPDDVFELFYCDKEWKSAGVIKDEALDSLLFKEIPKGVLLYLKNHTRGAQERIFTYEEGQQKWL